MRGDGTDGSASAPEREVWSKKFSVVSAVSWKMVWSTRVQEGMSIPAVRRAPVRRRTR